MELIIGPLIKALKASHPTKAVVCDLLISKHMNLVTQIRSV